MNSQTKTPASPILVIALNETAYDMYRHKHNLAPTEARRITHQEQLRGYNPGTPVVAVGNWYEGDRQREAHDLALKLGYSVSEEKL